MIDCAVPSEHEKKPILLRKRFIPSEVVSLDSDELLYRDESILITKWRTIRPKVEFASGVSYYFPDKHYKISRFYDHSGSFLYWYCDIISTEYSPSNDAYLFLDLLLDIKLYPDGRLVFLDEDELEEALALTLITLEQYYLAKSTSRILSDEIRRGVFPPLICLDPKYW